MYACNQFSQSSNYASEYPANFYPYGNNYYYPAYNSWFQSVGNQTINEDPIILLSKKREDNQKFIENFIKVEESSDRSAKKSEEKKKTLRIFEAKKILLNTVKETEKLEKLSKELKSNENLSDSEWKIKHQECLTIQNEINEMLKKFDNEIIIDNLKKLIDKRRQKRLREVRKRGAWKLEKSRIKEKRARRHAEADAWIREKQEIIEREKQVEHLRKDADIVLADVRGKRNDAKKFLGLLQELKNLRNVKINIARARGENLPPAADLAFDNIIGQLLDQWTCLDREYSIEEQGLKLMLKTDNEEKIEKQKKSTFDDWEIVLFGKKLQSFDSSRDDLHSLIMIRHAWDKYANYRGKGSRVPIGWVMPVVPSSAAWQKCLKRD